MKKGDIIFFSSQNEEYEILNKENYGDFLKITFRYKEEIWFGIVLGMTSSGRYKVHVKGIYGTDSEEGLV